MKWLGVDTGKHFLFPMADGPGKIQMTTLLAAVLVHCLNKYAGMDPDTSPS